MSSSFPDVHLGEHSTHLSELHQCVVQLIVDTEWQNIVWPLCCTFTVIKCRHQQTSERNSQQHGDSRQLEHVLTEAILLVLLQRQSWLRTTVWPGWIRTVGSDWATRYMRHQPLTMEPRTHAGTRSSSVQCRLGWTPFTWKYLMRWGAHRVFSYTFTETDN